MTRATRARAHANPRTGPGPRDHGRMPTSTIDNAPSVPFDLATVAARPLDLDTMTRIAEDAGRAATVDADPVAGAPMHAATVAAWNPLTAAARLWRAAYRGARNPATE